MGFRARLMAGLTFLDLAESNDMPHAQVGEGRRFCSKKSMDYSPGILGTKIGDPLRFGRVAYRWTRLGLKSSAQPSAGP